MNITVTCEHATPLGIAVKAIRQCYESFENSDSIDAGEHGNADFKLGEKDKALIERIIATGHTSTIEHLNFTFNMKGYSRALLQEKSRHRIASVSEKSTRYCLGKLKHEEPFISELGILEMERAKKYLVYTGITQVDTASIYALEALRQCIVDGIPNDKAKFCLPDSLKSECYFTINARSLRNFFELRTSSKALWEIQILAHEMYNSLPPEYKFLFSDTVSNSQDI